MSFWVRAIEAAMKAVKAPITVTNSIAVSELMKIV